MVLVESTKKMDKKPEINFYCLKCNLFFRVEEGTHIDDIKCPDCQTDEVFLELNFKDKETPNYYS